MKKDLSNFRKSYEKGELLIKDTPGNPLELFNKWFKEINDSFPDVEANAMTLSTIGLDGFPKSRVVLLKKFDKNGFIFYTNYTSEKGKAIFKNSKVCLSFFWAEAERQVIIKGNAVKSSKAISDTYFDSRPRGSRLGALTSNQSEVIEDRNILEDRLKVLEHKFIGKEIPRPDFWGGFIVDPLEIEFWQGRANRLHDRIHYKLNAELHWIKTRLAP